MCQARIASSFNIKLSELFIFQAIFQVSTLQGVSKYGSSGMEETEWRDLLVALRTWRASEGIMCLNLNGSLSSETKPL